MSEVSKNSEGAGLSKSEIALYVGVPLAAACIAGCACYYYLNRGKSEEEKDPEAVIIESKKENKKSNDAQKEPEKTPEQQAVSLKLKGNKYFAGGKFQKAIECYTDAINVSPADKVDSSFYQNRAAAYEKLDMLNNVIEDCSKAIELNPKYTKALARRAKTFETLGKKIDCLEDVTAVCLLEGFQNQEFLLLAEKVIKEIGKEKAAEYIKKREKVLPSGISIQSYLDSFSSDPFSANFSEEDEEKSSYYKAIVDMKNGKFDNMINLCSEEINQDGCFKMKALLLRGTIHTLMSSMEEALKDYNEVINCEECETMLKINALIKRATVRCQEAKQKECFDDFEQAIGLDGNNADVYHHRGQVSFLTEKLDDAKKDFEKAISCDENFVPPRLQLGYCICKMAMQMYSPTMMQDANQLLQETTVKFPDYAEAWSLFGQLLQDQQQFSEADEKFDKAIELNPKNPATHVYKALLYLQWKKDIDTANKMIREAIRLDDKCDFAYETLASLEVQRGNTEEAVSLFEKAIDLVRTEAEMAQAFSLLEAAKAQGKVIKRLGITPPMAASF
eukprot:gene11323-12509_t